MGSSRMSSRMEIVYSEQYLAVDKLRYISYTITEQ